MDSNIEILGKQVGCTWPAISKCAETARDHREELVRLVDSESLVPTDAALVTFGSLAREESTSGSDLDWTLLVDGPADPQHVRLAQQVGQKLEGLGKKQPGSTGLFGGLTFSHELIHEIGGESDKNSNTTRRILLLLESCAIGDDVGVRDRVTRHLFTRYVSEDRGYHRSRNWEVKVPRFLLNDIVRYWRTMAVDYARKRRDRGSEGWALRNFKLRLSRKLIFVSGLAMCLLCHLRPSEALANRAFEGEEEFNQLLVDSLVEFSNQTPLSIVANTCIEFKALEAAKLIFGSYDRFLAILNDGTKRRLLEELSLEDANDDTVFSEARDIGSSFQEGLNKLFFGTDAGLTQATQRYGVF